MKYLIQKAKSAFSSADQIIVYLIYLLVALLPFVYDTKVKAIFEAPKLFWLRAITLLILLLWGLDVCKQRRLNIKVTAVQKLSLLYGFICLLTMLFSTHVFSSLLGNQGRFLGVFTILNFLVLLWIVAHFVKKPRQVINIIIISGLIAVIVSIWSVLQHQGILSPAEKWTTDPEERAFATFGHSNHLGAYLAFHFMLLLGLACYVQKKWLRIAVIVAGLILVPGILATASRGAVFALIGGVIIFGLFLIFIHRHAIIHHKNKYLAGIIALALIVGIFQRPIFKIINNLSVTKRTIATIEFLRQGHIPDRVSWWYSSLAMIKDRPILGHGLSTYKDVYNQYRRSDYRVPADEQDIQVPETAHMEYFTIAATQGLLGLFVYFLFIASFFKLMISSIRQTKTPERYITLGVLTAIITYLIQVLISFGTVITLFYLYLFMGLGLAWVLATAHPKAQDFSFTIIHRKLFLLSVFVLVTVGLHFSYRYYLAEHLYRVALSYDSVANNKATQGLGEEASGLYSQALANYQELTTLAPHEYTYLSAMADSAFDGALVQKNLDDALYYLNISVASGQKALAVIDNQPHIHANLALTYFALQRAYDSKGSNLAADYFQKAVAEYEKALAASPNNPLYIFRFAQIYALAKQYDKAIDYFQKTLAIRDNYKEAYFELAKIYLELKDYPKAKENITKALQFAADPRYIDIQQKTETSLK